MEENVLGVGNSSSWQAQLVIFKDIHWNCLNSDVNDTAIQTFFGR